AHKEPLLEDGGQKEEATDGEATEDARVSGRSRGHDGLRHSEADARGETGRGSPDRAATRKVRVQLPGGHRYRALERLHPAGGAGPVGGRTAAGRVHGRSRGLQPAQDLRGPLSGRDGYLLRGPRQRPLQRTGAVTPLLEEVP